MFVPEISEVDLPGQYHFLIDIKADQTQILRFSVAYKAPGVPGIKNSISYSIYYIGTCCTDKMNALVSIMDT